MNIIFKRYYSRIRACILIVCLLTFYDLPRPFFFSSVTAHGETGALNISFGAQTGGMRIIKTYSYVYPYGFKISRDGSLFLSNTADGSIMQFDFMGRPVKSYSGEIFDSTGDITFDNDGMLYFASLKSMQIIKVDMLSREQMRFGGRSGGDAGLSSIYQIEAAAGKKIFVQDILSHKINAYSPTGAFIKKIECNTPGFCINSKGELLYFNYDPYTGYSLFIAEVNKKSSKRVFSMGLNAFKDFEFIGSDYKGNIYIAISRGYNVLCGERTIAVYNSNGIYIAGYMVKKSPLKRQFFLFGDGSLYSAETDGATGSSLPSKMSIKKY